MCGINGIYAYHYAANPIDREELLRTRDHMAARGPDGKGEWVSEDARIGFGHRRLSIIDLSDAGAQPMTSADGKLVVTFNGEIYNFKALRAELEGKGRMFRTQSDTEVLLHLYAEKGEAMVHDLRGMFAFALWDAEKRALLLARDPYGIKPLYYADDGWTFRFASQVKALLAGGKVSKDPEPAGWVGFYLFGSVPEPWTTYQEVRAVPAGATIWVDKIGPREAKRYHSIAEAYCRAEADPVRLSGESLAGPRPRRAPRLCPPPLGCRRSRRRVSVRRYRLRSPGGPHARCGAGRHSDRDACLRGVSRPPRRRGTARRGGRPPI